MVMERCLASGGVTAANVEKCKGFCFLKSFARNVSSVHELEQLKGKGTCSCTWMNRSSRIEPLKVRRICSESADGAPFSSRIPAAKLVQGTAGLVLIVGSLGMAAKLMWQKASQVASLPPGYEATLEFPFASGITIGTVVRIRGVEVGSVISVRPCLESIDAQIKVIDSKSYIPRNALVEVNQSGLVGETIIDITPVSPIPHPAVGPLEPGCLSEGVIVCHKERIKGQQGVSMDDLIRLCGKMSRNTQEADIRDFFETAERFEDALSNSKVMLDKLEKSTVTIEAVAKKLQDGGILRSLNELLKQTSRTIYTLRMSKFMMEPRRSLTNSVSNVTETLQDMQSISAEAKSFLKVEKNRKNMKHLVEVLSRLVD